MAKVDPIADMLTIIRNGYRAGKEKVDCPGSKITRGILEVLKQEEYIQNYRFFEDGKQGVLRTYLKFLPSPTGREVDKVPAVTGLKRISRPGLRIYAHSDEVPQVLGGLGCAILSTSKGILADKKARELGIGGEVLCYVW